MRSSAQWKAVEPGTWGDGKYLAISDMNPTHKKFWAYLRANPEDENETSAMKHYRVKHIDHPHFYVWLKKKWTNKGRGTVDGLDRAYVIGTFDHMRNVLGEFCSAEGAVYPQFIPKKHNVPISRNDISVDAKWRYSCDWGGINAVGLYADNYNGKHCLFKEIYRKDESVQEIIGRMKALEAKYRIPGITDCFVDHEIDNRHQMREAGYPYTLALKKNKAGAIEDVKTALSNVQIVINANSLDDPDPQLTINCLVDELLALAYKPEERRTYSKSDDLPDPKCEDHAADHFQYYVVGCVVRPQIDFPPVMKTVSSIQAGEMTFGV